MSTVYSFDTSAWIGWWHEIYPRETFPDVSELIDQDVRNEVIKSPAEVREELEKKVGDELAAWAKGKHILFIPSSAQNQDLVADVTEQCPKIIKPQPPNADPYVIALALQHRCAVVTQENPRKQTGMAACCASMGVECISLPKYVTRRHQVLNGIRASIWSAR